jgi:hypothetical protein
MLLEPTIGSFKIVVLLLELLNLLLKSLLMSLFAMSGAHSRLSVLESLSGLLVLHGIFKIGVGSIFIDDGILQILLLLIG